MLVTVLILQKLIDQLTKQNIIYKRPSMFSLTEIGIQNEFQSMLPPEAGFEAMHLKGMYNKHERKLKDRRGWVGSLLDKNHSR